MSNNQTPTIKLDWSRLLGFDQAGRTGNDASAARLNAPRLAKLGAKVGNKEGIRMPSLL